MSETKRRLVHASSYADKFKTVTYGRMANPEAYGVINTKFPKLDDRIKGLRAGQLIVLGARTSEGKSCFAGNIALNIALQGKRVLYCSYEMSAEEMTQRWISSMASIPQDDLEKPLTDICKLKFEEAVEVFKGLDIFILCDNRLSDVEGTLEDIGGVDLVVIDHLHFMHYEKESELASLTILTKGLKQMATKANTRVLLLSQLNRECTRRGTAPTSVDLRGCGTIENDANTILLLHTISRPVDTSQCEVKEILVVKARNGVIGGVKFYFSGKYAKFLEI